MNAVIYSRVSSTEQVEGTSLDSQEGACREYARAHNLNVIEVFREQGESAKFADRTQLLRLLAFCKDKRTRVTTLIVWKLDRFSRNVEDHFALKATLRKAGVTLASATDSIAEDPNGRLLETILAGFSQFDNDVRALRTVQGLQQRVREGIYPFKPPLGYVAPKIGKKTVADRPDPKCFELLRKAWRLLATGAYTQADVLRLLRTWGVRGGKGAVMSAQTIAHIFRNPFYTGHFRDPWTGEMRQGKHVPMVTSAEFAAVQEVLNRTKLGPTRTRLSPDFPLRGMVRCPSCSRPLTGAFSKGRSRRYPYYSCFNRDCTRFRKTITADVVDREFQSCLRSLSVPDHLTDTLVEAIVAESREQSAHARASVASRNAERAAIERQQRELLTLRVRGLVSDDEFICQRDRLRKELLQLEGVDYHAAARVLSEGDAREATEYLRDMRVLWSTLDLTERRCFGEFAWPLGYVAGRIRTAETALVFRIHGVLQTPESDYVAFIKNNLNQILDEIARFLAIARRVQPDAMRRVADEQRF